MAGFDLELLRAEGGVELSFVPRKALREGGLACASEGMMRSQIMACEAGEVGLRDG